MRHFSVVLFPSNTDVCNDMLVMFGLHSTGMMLGLGLKAKLFGLGLATQCVGLELARFLGLVVRCVIFASQWLSVYLLHETVNHKPR